MPEWCAGSKALGSGAGRSWHKAVAGGRALCAGSKALRFKARRLRRRGHVAVPNMRLALGSGCGRRLLP